MSCFVVLALASCAAAFVAPSQLPSSKVMARSGHVVAFGGKSSAAPKKAKKAVAKKSTKQSKSTEGKGGILPWVTNTPGTYAKPLMLSSVDFLGDDGDAWIGWGFMPDSVKKLYNRKSTRKGGILNK